MEASALWLPPHCTPPPQPSLGFASELRVRFPPRHPLYSPFCTPVEPCREPGVRGGAKDRMESPHCPSSSAGGGNAGHQCVCVGGGVGLHILLPHSIGVQRVHPALSHSIGLGPPPTLPSAPLSKKKKKELGPFKSTRVHAGFVNGAAGRGRGGSRGPACARRRPRSPAA
jgi:hypothetical protein